MITFKSNNINCLSASVRRRSHLSRLSGLFHDPISTGLWLGVFYVSHPFVRNVSVYIDKKIVNFICTSLLCLEVIQKTIKLRKKVEIIRKKRKITFQANAIHTHTHTHTHTYIYIFIERQRERELKKSTTYREHYINIISNLY